MAEIDARVDEVISSRSSLKPGGQKKKGGRKCEESLNLAIRQSEGALVVRGLKGGW